MSPKFSLTAPTAHGPTRSALLALTLAGLAALLVALPVPNAAAGADKTSPSAPHNLRVLVATQVSLDLVWDAATDDVGIEGYKVWFGQPTAKKPLNQQPPVRTREARFTATELTCGQSYQVEVLAFDHANNASEVLKSVVSTSPCVDNQPPSAPSGLQQIAASATSATLAWGPSTDNTAVAGYSLSRVGIELGTTSETSYTFGGLSCGKTSAVSVRAYDVARNYSIWVNFYVTTTACGDVSAPTAPTRLVQTNQTISEMSAAWSPSTDNIGVARYDVFRDGAVAGSTNGVSYSLSGLNCGTSYTVGVEGVDGAGNRSARTSSTMSTAPCVTPPPQTNDTQPPSVPTNLALAAASPTSMTLTWLGSTDNVGVTGYRTFHDGAPVQLVTGTTSVFQGLSCGTSHQLGVIAYDAKGNHSALASVTASTAPCSDTSPPSMPQNPVVLNRTSSSATVSWSASTDNVTVAGYGAYVGGQLDGSTSTTTYTFTGLACNTSVFVGLDAYDAAGNRSNRVTFALTTTICNDTQPPTAPSQLTVSGATPTDLTLNWAASSDNSGVVTGYDVFVNGVKTATASATEYTLGNLTCNTTYTLGVQAVDGAGNRSGLLTVKGTTAPCSLPPPPGGSGSLFVSPTGSDANSCVQVAPCKSFDRAYRVAQPGAVVSVASGVYSGQTIEWMQGRDTAAQVRFVPQGQVAINGNLEVAASGVYIDGAASGSMGSWRSRTFSFTVAGYTSVEGRSSTQYPHNVTLEGIDTSVLGTYSSQNVRVSDVDVGPSLLDWNGGCSIPENKISRNGAAVPVEPTNVLWERVAIHDQNRTQAAANGDCHYGGLFLANGQGVTIRESVFEQNVVYNIQVQNFGGNAPSNVTIENNWFGCPVENSYTPNGVNTCDGQPSLQFNAASLFSNWLIRYNSFVSSIGQYVPGASYSNVRVVGNAGDQPSAVCGKPGITFTRNAWTGACSSFDKVISNPFVSTVVGAEDLHLVAGSGAIDAGDPSNVPGSDFDGQGRPMGGAPDAGADERS